jgi:hypothetical protein
MEGRKAQDLCGVCIDLRRLCVCVRADISACRLSQAAERHASEQLSPIRTSAIFTNIVLATPAGGMSFVAKERLQPRPLSLLRGFTPLLADGPSLPACNPHDPDVNEPRIAGERGSLGFERARGRGCRVADRHRPTSPAQVASRPARPLQLRLRAPARRASPWWV